MRLLPSSSSRHLLLVAVVVVSAELESSLPPFVVQSSGSYHISGQIVPEAQCSVEDLEEANDSQLYTILHQLRLTQFFRNFEVDLETECPLKKTKKPPTSSTPSAAEATITSETKEQDQQTTAQPEETCASDGLPDLDPDAEPACHVAMDDPFGGPFGGASSTGSSPFGGAATAGRNTATTAQTPPAVDKATTTPTTIEENKDSDDTSESTAATDDSEDNDDDDDSFDCGSDTDTEDLDLDEDAEPLCHLSEEHRPSFSSALYDICKTMALETIKKLGWESKSQQDTYEWNDHSDVVVEELSEGDTACDDQDEFWLDMCSSSILSGKKRVNLALNPERNTVYNGTHIWNAMYEENCLGDASNEDEECYEERVLYRLLSGLHTSTTLSIAKQYYPPSKRKNRVSWEPNPILFWKKFHKQPDHLRNLHFSYVVLLRALRKASAFLYDYDIRTGNIVEDETATILLRRLLDSAILNSCQPVFSAFDESLMFKGNNGTTVAASTTTSSSSDDSLIVTSLQRSFKGVFQNISSILDCVQCQQCKLHAKLTVLGYGTALKILFVKNPQSLIHHLSKNEIVAFINTIAKFSESMKDVRELTQLYWKQQQEEEQRKQPTAPSNSPTARTNAATATTTSATEALNSSTDLVDATMRLISNQSRQNKLDESVETQLIQLTIQRSNDLLILTKHYHMDPDRWTQLVKLLISPEPQQPDAIVVGSGLAGMATALNVLDRGGSIVMVEKEHRLGGNSNKASSGINACCPPENATTYGDFLESFQNDTIRSAGGSARPDLIQVLVSNSANAVSFLRDRVGVDLSLMAQLGGHSHKRTHRPNNGMAGAEIIYGMQKAVRQYEKSGKVKIMVDTKVTSLKTNSEGRVIGVEVEGSGGQSDELLAVNVVLATGGFASDRSDGSYLSQYRPELLNMPATAGAFSTGDGVTLAKSLGAGTVDMKKVQIHPTGWVDPADPTNPSKVLAAELMRGVGGILINKGGQRFCNELGTRAYVTDKMLSHDPIYAKTRVWDKEAPIPTFSLVLSSSAALDGKKHVDLYSHKGLLTELGGLSELASWIGIDEDVLRDTLVQYQQDAAAGVDQWGKVSFRGIPVVDLDSETFYAGTVTPVLHYCMGGITIDAEGSVLNEEGDRIQGLHAAGEVTGGVHGDNRLGGNSLLECTVFGTIVGKKLPIQIKATASTVDAITTTTTTIPDEAPQETKEIRRITQEELDRHNDEGDCWVAINGVVYDLTAFAEEHPAGPESIHELAGKDGSDAFNAVHNEDVLEDFEEERLGVLV